MHAPVLNMAIYNYISKYSHSAELKFKSVVDNEDRDLIFKFDRSDNEDLTVIIMIWANIFKVDIGRK